MKAIVAGYLPGNRYAAVLLSGPKFCKGHCDYHSMKKGEGQYCGTCGVWMPTAKRCICCNRVMRGKPRNNDSRNQLAVARIA